MYDYEKELEEADKWIRCENCKFYVHNNIVQPVIMEPLSISNCPIKIEMLDQKGFCWKFESKDELK